MTDAPCGKTFPELDLSGLQADLTKVKDLRRTEIAHSVDAPAPSWIGWFVIAVLFIPTLVLALACLLLVLAAWPFDLALRVLTGRKGLAIGVALMPLAVLMSSFSEPIRRRQLANIACPLCGRTGRVQHMVDVTHDGNLRVSLLLGFEPSVPAAGPLVVPERHRLTVLRCDACYEHFLEGPFRD